MNWRVPDARSGLVGVAYARISSEIAGGHQDVLAASGRPFAVCRNETVFELSYMFQVAPWWSIQPDVQFNVRPNAGQNPADPTLTLGNVLGAGVRSTVTFCARDQPACLRPLKAFRRCAGGL